MLRVHEEKDHCRWLRVHVVVRDRRPAIVSRGDDTESCLWKRGNRTGSTIDRHRSSTVQDHEGWWTPPHCQRTIFRKKRLRNQIDNPFHSRGSSSCDIRYISRKNIKRKRKNEHIRTMKVWDTLYNNYYHVQWIERCIEQEKRVFLALDSYTYQWQMSNSNILQRNNLLFCSWITKISKLQFPKIL